MQKVRTEKQFIRYLTDDELMYLSGKRKFMESPSIDNSGFYFLKVSDICYDDQAPRKEALENVLSSLTMKGICFVFLILGRKENVDFYYGIAKDVNEADTLAYDVFSIGENILKPAIQGNFRGSKVTTLTPDEKKSIRQQLLSMNETGIIEGVPGANKDDEKYQGIDRLINVMYGDSYGFMVIAKPLDRQSVLQIQQQLYRFYDKKAPIAKTSVQFGQSQSTNQSASTTKGTTSTDGTNYSQTKTKGTSSGNSSTHGWNSGTQHSNSHNTGDADDSYSTSSSGSEGKSGSKTTQTGKNDSSGTTEGYSYSFSKNKSSSDTSGTGSSFSGTATKEYSNREVQDLVKFMDDIVFPRLDYGKGKGMFLTSMCIMAANKISLKKLENTITALFSGESGNKVPLKAFDADENAQQSFCSFQLPVQNYNHASEQDEEAYLSHFAMQHYIPEKGCCCLGNWITTNELGMIAGLPQKEVVGLALNEEVSFGLNYTEPAKEDRIPLGRLINNGNVLENSFVYLDKQDLDKHIFIAGVTGSGKTTTCQSVLKGANLPFLVIEPAKTEYRIMQQEHKDLLVFTLGDNQGNPLRMNPFVFYPHENIVSRVDMIRACIEAAFDMEAAIPQIIEQALYDCYREKGWNIDKNINLHYDNPFNESGEAFPTISDLIRQCENVVKKQGFDERLQKDYIGSIKARLMGLTNGGKGFLLNAQSSVDFRELLRHKVVFELENIRSGSEKSLIMGFILINLSQAIRELYEEQGTFRHITLVEEAHRLLSKYNPGDDRSKKQSVEMFSDMLAEIRKYGESMIIVDQIPNKLTPDVLKNTNTKIIHRLFAADDKDAVGNTVMLTDEQKQFLSNLSAGRAVYFSTGTEKAVQIEIIRNTDTSAKSPSREDIRSEAMIQFYLQEYRRGLYYGLEYFPCQPQKEQFMALCQLNEQKAPCWHRAFNKNNHQLSSDTEQEISAFSDLLGRDMLTAYFKNDGDNAFYRYITQYF